MKRTGMPTENRLFPLNSTTLSIPCPGSARTVSARVYLRPCEVYGRMDDGRTEYGERDEGRSGGRERDCVCTLQCTAKRF